MKKEYIGFIVLILIVFWLFGGEEELAESNDDTVEIVDKKSFDPGNIDGFYNYITSTKFNKTCRWLDTNDIIEFRVDSTYSYSQIDKRTDQIIKSSSGTFEVGEVKFLDGEEGTFRYIRLDRENWRVLTVSYGWYEYNGKELIQLIRTTVKGSVSFEGYDDYGPRVRSSNIVLASECDTYKPIQ